MHINRNLTHKNHVIVLKTTGNKKLHHLVVKLLPALLKGKTSKK